MSLSRTARRELGETVRRVLSSSTTRHFERPEGLPRGGLAPDVRGVRNVGSQAIPIGGVVAVKKVVWEVGRGPTWEVERPGAKLASEYLVCVHGEIEPEARGQASAAIAQPVFALASQVPGSDDDITPGQAWGVVADSFELRLRRPGFRGLGSVRRRDDETLIAVWAERPTQWIGRPTAAIVASDEGEITLWDAGQQTPDELPPAALGITVQALALTEAVLANRWVAVTWIAGRWIVTPLECA